MMNDTAAPNVEQPSGPVSPKQIDYSSLLNAVKISSKPLFWLTLFISIFGGFGVLVGGGLLMGAGWENTGGTIGVIGLLLMIVPTIAYVHKFKAAYIKSFAADNNFGFYNRPHFPEYDGILTQIERVSAMSAYPLLVCDEVDGPFAELCNLTFSVVDRIQLSSRRQETQRNWAYVSVKLPKSVPRIFLDSKKNSGAFWMDSLPFTFDKSQKLNMEDNFNDTFSLYAPMNYAADAYYIFRREVLKILMEAAEAYDIELCGDRLYVYRMKKIDFMKPNDIYEMVYIAWVLKSAFHETTKRYKDSYPLVLSAEQMDRKSQGLQAG